jgi:C4-dicarboxylate-specific signal transduction histidine kinase
LTEESQNIIEFVHYDEIDIEIKVTNGSTIFNYKNEYKQVLLNLLSNAKDVLLSRKILHPKITITIDNKKVTVADNAGGIQLDVIEKIFEPYFTTKESGLGIGLYMSKVIIENNMRGSLNVQNVKSGAIFIILLP